MRFLLITHFVSLITSFLILSNHVFAASKPIKGLPYACASSCYNTSTNMFELYIKNTSTNKGFFATDEISTSGIENWLDWGNFLPGKVKVMYFDHETTDSTVQAYDPFYKLWIIQGWYKLNVQEHVNSGWVCPLNLSC